MSFFTALFSGHKKSAALLTPPDGMRETDIALESSTCTGETVIGFRSKADGHLLNARSVEAEQAATIIPVTESSSGRTGKAPGAHPLCDQIQFLSPLYPAKYESYLTQLHRWELSPYGLSLIHI